jgi:surfeit locus 1 family protein
MKRRLFATLCLLLAAGFAALGIWQVERRAWKLGLIARVEARVHAAPRPLPNRATWKRLDPEDLAYTRMSTRGVFLNDRETLVQALTDAGAGWWVVTPLQTRSGIVLINRGFVPPEYREPNTRRAGSPDGEVAVTGLVRVTEPSGGFLRTNDPAADRWYSRDVASIARRRQLADVAPFFIDADATPNPGGYPLGGLTVIAFRNTHLVYALTWFTLAGFAAGGTVMVLRKAEKR